MRERSALLLLLLLLLTVICVYTKLVEWQNAMQNKQNAARPKAEHKKIEWGVYALLIPCSYAHLLKHMQGYAGQLTGCVYPTLCWPCRVAEECHEESWGKTRPRAPISNLCTDAGLVMLNGGCHSTGSERVQQAGEGMKQGWRNNDNNYGKQLEGLACCMQSSRLGQTQGGGSGELPGWGRRSSAADRKN